MTSKVILFAIALSICLLPTVNATDFTENFNGYNLYGSFPVTNPNPTPAWYNYTEFSDVGSVTNVAPIIEGSQSFRFVNNVPANFTNADVKFTLTNPIQLTALNFTIRAQTVANATLGTQQKVTIESGFPIRRVVEFYDFCTNDTGNVSLNAACQLNVRWQTADATGQTLIPYTSNQNNFQINATFNWTKLTFNLKVNGVDDGWFPFFELPTNIGILQIDQFRQDIPANVTFDMLQVFGAQNVTSGVVDGDAAQGLKGFASDMHFTSGTSLFVFGVILFVAMMAALITAMFSHGKTNAIAPAAGFFAIILTFWLIQMQFWPDWIGIAFIIIVSSMIGLVLRRLMLGVTNANNGPSIIVGSLGYFVICATFLAMAGYSQTQITIPTGTTEEAGATSQSFGEATLECVVTLFGDCSQHTVSKLWKTITDIFGWIQAAFEFLFQLLTFQLPIPVVLNMMIVLPPAASLVTYAIQVIRG